MSGTGVLRTVAAALDAAGIPFMLTGSLASTLYGAGRTTVDIDLVIDPTAEQIRALAASLPVDEFYMSLEAALEARQHASFFNVIDQSTGWKVDLIICKPRPFSRMEFERRVPIAFDGIHLAVATVEDVILAKLEWAKLGGSARQIEDVAALLTIRGADLDSAYLERWIADLRLTDQWEAARRHS